MILFELFASFFRIALFSIGGGYAAMPLIRSEIVDARGILTLSEFADLVTIAEMTPGPIQLNAATFAGMRAAGLPGAICATLGVIAPSIVLVSGLALAYRRYGSLAAVKGTLGYLRPAVVALIASAALDILLLVVFSGAEIALENVNWTSVLLFAAALLALRKKKISPPVVMALCGGASLLLGVLFGGV